jgi:hypothetical protein
MQLMLRCVLIAGLVTAAAPLAVAQQGMVEDVTTLTATVESVDVAHRTVLLRAPDGLVTVDVGPGVKNLPQVKAGDHVRVQLREALIARVAPPESKNEPPQAASQTMTAKPGQKPAGVHNEMIRANVRITQIDAPNNIVQFVGPAGVPRVAHVKDPSMQALLHKLKVGDVVQMTYSVAVAVRVEPAGG